MCDMFILIQRSPTECGVPGCDREASIMRRPWPTGGCCAIKQNMVSHPMLRCVILTTGRNGRVLKLGRNVSRWISAMPCRYKLLRGKFKCLQVSSSTVVVVVYSYTYSVCLSIKMISVGNSQRRSAFRDAATDVFKLG